MLKKLVSGTAVLCGLGALGLLVVPAAAQEWRRGTYEYFKDRPHPPHCEYRIAAHGGAPFRLFGGQHESRKAEVRAIKDWEFEASRLFGPQFASWDLAEGKEVRCQVKGLEFECLAAANPCRPHRR